TGQDQELACRRLGTQDAARVEAELIRECVLELRDAIRDGIDGVWLARGARWGLAALDTRHVRVDGR
ncbi:MAG: hypothetical protein KDA71_16235, partial [Planctomycetales bacterium]|nr:hypothetical protein [Planctomycetales bacterium]